MAVAQRATYLWRFSEVADHAKEWRKRIREFRRQARESGALYKEVRYEDLVLNTKAIVENVCQFIDLAFSDALLDYYMHAESRISELEDLDYPRGRICRDERLDLYKCLSGPPDRSHIGRWRAGLSLREIETYERVAGELLAEFGFETHAVSPPRALEAHSRSADAVPTRSTFPATIGSLSTAVKDVERVVVNLPFRERVARHMIRENPFWTYFEICKVSLECGITGFGETMLSYRRILHFNVTAHPTAEWTAQQLRDAFPWDAAPRYLLRDRDRIFGDDFTKQVQDMGIKEVLSTPRAPWQRAYVERVIGTIRRECLDHLIVYNEASLCRHLKSFVTYYHQTRTHLGLDKDTPEEVERELYPTDAGRRPEGPGLDGGRQ